MQSEYGVAESSRSGIQLGFIIPGMVMRRFSDFFIGLELRIQANGCLDPGIESSFRGLCVFGSVSQMTR